MPMEWNILRVSSSKALGSDFILQEKCLLTSLGANNYFFLENPQDKLSLDNLKETSQIIMLTNTHTKLEKIPAWILKRTSLLIHSNSGMDNFHPQILADLPCPIITGNSIRSAAVTEYIMACLFHHITSINDTPVWPENRLWNRRRICDLNILVYGFGHIGKKVARTLKSLEAKVTVIDPHVHDPINVLPSNHQLPMEQFDCLILCCELNQENQEFINHQFLAKLSPQILIINPARGQLIKLKDLFEFLKNHQNAKAYLDVFEPEPFPFHEYFHLKNLIKSPHTAGVYAQLSENILKFEFQVIKKWMEYHPKTQNFINHFQDIIYKK